MTGPEFVSPAEADAHKAERVRDLMLSIQHAALAHAATLYTHHAEKILQAAQLPDGTPYRVLRIINPDCAECGHSGVRFAIEERPRQGTEHDLRITNTGRIKFAPMTTEPVATIRECACVRYELHTAPMPEPEQTETDR